MTDVLARGHACWPVGWGATGAGRTRSRWPAEWTVGAVRTRAATPLWAVHRNTGYYMVKVLLFRYLFQKKFYSKEYFGWMLMQRQSKSSKCINIINLSYIILLLQGTYVICHYKWLLKLLSGKIFKQMPIYISLEPFTIHKPQIEIYPNRLII